MSLACASLTLMVSVWLSRLALAQPARGAQLSCSAVLCRQHAFIATPVCPQKQAVAMQAASQTSGHKAKLT